MAHYQYTQEENVAFTSCKRKVVKLLKPANEATKQGARGGGMDGWQPLERGVKITVTKLDKLSSESYRTRVRDSELNSTQCCTLWGKNKKKPSFLISGARLGKQMKTNAQRL